MTTNSTILEARLTEQFGDAYSTALSPAQPMGRRIHGVDLTQPLSTDQAKFAGGFAGSLQRD